MNIYEEIAASWAALDVALVIAWHIAHVRVRARALSVQTRPLQTRPAQARPAKVRPMPVRTPTPSGHLTLVKAG